MRIFVCFTRALYEKLNIFDLYWLSLKKDYFADEIVSGQKIK